MITCDLKDTCFMFNFGLSGMPLSTQYLKFKYCLGNYADCPWYKNCNKLWDAGETEEELTEMFGEDIVAGEIRKSEIN